MAISRLSIIKFLELVLTLICLGLHYKTFHANDIHEMMIITGCFVGYVIILLGGFAGHLMSTPINRRIDIFFCLVGCAMFIASGAFSIQYYDRMSSGEVRNTGLAKAAMAIINGALFLLDSLLTWRGEY
ncbi:uncharacterized protein CBL_09052 [Carabus blaptoides fortunei]